LDFSHLGITGLLGELFGFETPALMSISYQGCTEIIWTVIGGEGVTAPAEAGT
jgi:hypothetical protein